MEYRELKHRAGVYSRHGADVTMAAMHETFDHTADLGYRIRAADLDTLFAEAGQVLFETIVEDLKTVRLEKRVDITLAGAEPDYLLFDWLKELLYHFDAEHLLLGKFEVRFTKEGLTGSAWGEPLDRARHNLEHEVKAITYHGLRVERVDDCWLAEVIVDI
jgi:SHS2 domain-containing protein